MLIEEVLIEKERTYLNTPGRLRARSGSKLPTANVPLRALDGWGAKDGFISVGVRSALFGVLRFG